MTRSRRSRMPRPISSPQETIAAVPPPGAPQVLIVDDRLRDERGHQLSFVSGMAEWLDRCGAVVEVWTHQAFDPALDVPSATVRRLFPLSWAEAFVSATSRTRVIAMLSHNRRFLCQMLRAGRGSRWDLVIATEASVFHLFAWWAWLVIAPRRTELLLVFVQPPWMLDYSPVDGSARAKPQACLYHWALRLLQRNLRTGRCRLAADSTAVATYLRNRGKWAVADIVVPAGHDRLALLTGSPPDRSNGLRLGVLGRPTRDRGFARVLAAIGQWCATAEPARPPVRFVVQWHADQDAHQEDYAMLCQLAGRFPKAIEIVERALDDEAYAGLIVSLHGGILAYDRSSYANRASHVALECLWTGRPFVATAGTWIAGEMAARGAGVICGTSPAEIVTAIAAFARDYEQLATLALSRRDRARDHCSWPRFFVQAGLPHFGRLE